MKQRKLVSKVFRACIDGDSEKLSKLRRKEFKKILKHRQEGKPFTARWTICRV